MKRFFSWIGKNLLQALGFLLPLGITLWVVWWLFGYTRKILRALDILSLWIPAAGPWQEFWLSLGSFVCVLVGILLVGIVLQGILGRWLHSLLDTTMEALPGVNVFYRAIKQLLTFLFQEKPPQKSGTGEVVLVQAFHDHTYSLGLVMGRTTTIDPAGKTWLKVFIPGVPNISSGFLLLVPEEKAIRVSTSLDQATAFLVSFGILKNMRRKP